MAIATTNGTGKALELRRLQDNPIFQQIAIMVGIAASVAIGVAVVLWSQTPSYGILFGGLAQKDSVAVAQALQEAGVDYRVDESNGAIMVPSQDLQEARMLLAGKGLPQSNAMGFELIQQDSGFGTSRLVENARYQKAIEGELARTIMTLAPVESARVHLAMPKQSVFIRNRKVPSASVALQLYPGRSLEQTQVEAITHLVASSVPELDASKVTVVDQKGRLLTEDKGSEDMQLTASQFEYTRNLEDHFKQRVEEILSPLLGRDNLRAEVTAEVDFTSTEQTHEIYNPDNTTLRSEQVNEQQSSQLAVQGVPGALSNQPPAAGTAPEVATAGATGGQAANPLNVSKLATRNYEVDKTISHTRLPSNRVRRLSVAVVVNNRTLTDAQGGTRVAERSPEEINRITDLVKEAVGYNFSRGDRVQVISEPFFVAATPEPLPEESFWQQPWFWDLLRQLGGLALVLLLIFGVLRPTMSHLLRARERQSLEAALANASLRDDEATLLSQPNSYEKTLHAARNMIADDPKRVAQVVKKWIAEDGR